MSCTPAECRAFPRLRSTLLDWAQQPVLCWVFALILYWFLTLPLAGPLDLELSTGWEWVIRHDLETMIVFFLMLPLTLGSGGVIGKVMGSRIGKYFGDISYGVYLWHLAMLRAGHASAAPAGVPGALHRDVRPGGRVGDRDRDAVVLLLRTSAAAPILAPRLHRQAGRIEAEPHRATP